MAGSSIRLRQWWDGTVAEGLRSAGTTAADAGLALGVALAISLPFVLPRSPGDVPVTWLGFVLALGTAVPLLWRTRAPFATALVISGFTMAVAVYRMPGQPLSYGLLIALYAVANHAGCRRRVLVLVLVLAGISVAALLRSEDALNYAFTMVLHAGAYGLGVMARLRRAYTSELEDRARRLERERAAHVERARAAERARIAHDMHDVLAHAVSLMVVQAEAGPVAVQAGPQRATETFDAIAAAGRDAMSQLRRLLGALNQDQAATPTLRISAIPGLADQIARTGMDVNVSMPDDLRPAPPEVEAAAFRIVQEALTNVIKHAQARNTEVRLAVDGDMLTVSVRDDGRGTRRDEQEPGYGLIGIRERAAACHGTATAGPAPHGSGFLVSARLPLTAPRDAS